MKKEEKACRSSIYNLYLVDENKNIIKILLENATCAECCAYDPERIKRQNLKRYADDGNVINGMYMVRLIEERRKLGTYDINSNLEKQWDRTVRAIKDRVEWCKEPQKGIKRCMLVDGHLRLSKIRGV